MKEFDLLKASMHKLASIEAKMVQRDDIENIHEQLYEQSEQLEETLIKVQELKGMLEINHLENINSDDVLLRSILNRQEIPYK